MSVTWSEALSPKTMWVGWTLPHSSANCFPISGGQRFSTFTKKASTACFDLGSGVWQEQASRTTARSRSLILNRLPTNLPPLQQSVGNAQGTRMPVRFLLTNPRADCLILGRDRTKDTESGRRDMFDAQLLFCGAVPATGIKVYSPWMSRPSDHLRATLEVAAIVGATIKVEVFTKNSEDGGDGTNADSGAGTFISANAVGRTT